MQTPVDLHSYTTHLAAKGSPAAEPAAASRLTIARRPALDLPFNPARGVRPPAAAASAGSRAPEPQAEDQDLNLELDVPAFLRRSERGGKVDRSPERASAADAGEAREYRCLGSTANVP
jgi:hypothetical protein